MFSIFNFKSNQNETPSEHEKRKTVTNDEKKSKRKKYEAESRKRSFQLNWLNEFLWLRYDKAKKSHELPPYMLILVCDHYSIPITLQTSIEKTVFIVMKISFTPERFEAKNSLQNLLQQLH